MTVTDDLLRNNADFAKTFSSGDLPMPPGRAWPSSPADAHASTTTPCSGCRRARPTSSATPVAWSATTCSARWSSPSACSAPAR